MHAIVAQRIVNQQLAQPRFSTPGELVGWLGAVQAQEYAGASWSLGLRLPGATEAQIDRAFDDGAILRTHALRPTWHFVAPGDIRWILQLTAPRVHAANAYSYRKFELDEALLRRGAAVLGKELAGTQRTRGELAQALARAGIEASGLRLGYIMMHAELEQLICSGPRRGKQFTYMLLDERVPPAQTLDRQAALAELAGRFFQSHGPALLEDFAGWCGLSLADARNAIRLCEPRLEQEQIGANTYWYGAASPATLLAPSAYLLPQYDEMISGYKDHALIIEQRYVEHAATARFFNMFMIDGRLLGNWRRGIARKKVQLETAPWRPLTDQEQTLYAAAAQRLSSFYGLSVWESANERE